MGFVQNKNIEVENDFEKPSTKGYFSASTERFSDRLLTKWTS